MISLFDFSKTVPASHFKVFLSVFLLKKKCEPWFVADENPSDLPVSNSSFNEEEILR